MDEEWEELRRSYRLNDVEPIEKEQDKMNNNCKARLHLP